MRYQIFASAYAAAIESCKKAVAAETSWWLHQLENTEWQVKTCVRKQGYATLLCLVCVSTSSNLGNDSIVKKGKKGRVIPLFRTFYIFLHFFAMLIAFHDMTCQKLSPTVDTVLGPPAPSSAFSAVRAPPGAQPRWAATSAHLWRPSSALGWSPSEPPVPDRWLDVTKLGRRWFSRIWHNLAIQDIKLRGSDFNFRLEAGEDWRLAKIWGTHFSFTPTQFTWLDLVNAPLLPGLAPFRTAEPQDRAWKPPEPGTLSYPWQTAQHGIWECVRRASLFQPDAASHVRSMNFEWNQQILENVEKVSKP